MGTTTIEAALVLKVPTELLGPKSEYDKRRLVLKKDVDKLLADAKKVTSVTSAEEEEIANNAGRVLQAESKEIERFFKPVKSQIDDFKAPVLKHEHEFADPVEAEKKRIGGLITSWKMKCAREKEERDRIAREEATLAAKKEAEDKALAEAALLQAVGDDEGAEELLSRPVDVGFVPVVTQNEASVKLPGQIGTKKLKVTVRDAKAVYQAIADGKLSMDCAPINVTWLNKKANLDQQAFSVPGCVAEPDYGTHFRA
jgi:hypothetical protein